MRVLLVFFLAACGEDLPAQADLSSSVCRLQSGRVCGYDTLGGCPADDSCNWCDCSAPGGAPACTLVGCPADGGSGVTTCFASTECPAGQFCAFDPGCTKLPGRCTSARECTSGSAATFCGCDGKTFTSGGPCADQPHSGRGGC